MSRNKNQIEIYLNESEQKFTLAFQNAPIGMALVSIDGYFLKVNQAICNILGYKNHELLNLDFQSITHPEDLEADLENVNNLLQGKINTYSIEKRYTHKSGKIVWTRLDVSLAKDLNQKPLYFISQIQDITLSKSQEIRLLEYQKLFNLSTNIVCIVSFEGKFLEVNPAFQHILGYDTQNVLNTNYIDYVHPDDVASTLKEENRLRTGNGTINFENRFKNKSGNYIFLSWNSVADLLQQRFYCIVKDISKEKENTMRLADFQHGLKALNTIASNSNLTYQQQLNQALSLASKHFKLSVGIISHIVGNTYSVMHFSNTHYEISLSQGMQFPFDQTYCHLTFQAQDALAITSMKESIYAKHPCYQNFKLEAYIGAPIFVNNNRFSTVNFSDTQSRINVFSQQDLEFIRLLARWIGAIIEKQEQQKALIASKEMAEKALQTKSDFLSTMSHEIRTPLNSVIGMAHLLIDDAPRQEQKQKLDTLMFSAQNLLSLINDILDYNKIEAGQLKLERIDFNLISLINSIKNGFEHQANQKGLKLKVRLDPEIPTKVRADQVRLTQILTNLISNALKFTKKGSVKIDVELEKEYQQTALVTFSVIDTGIGIAQNKHDAIFEQFTQAESSTTRRFGGTGLGLSITKKLLHLFNSQISLESTLDKGAKFYFSIELEKIATINSVNCYKENKRDKNLNGAKILIVEDNPTNQLVIKQFLLKWNTKIDFANNHQMAFTAFAHQDFDLVLMDLQLPEMDGFEIMAKLQEKFPQKTENTIFIALSAASYDEVGKKVISSGMVDFITKPFNPENVYSKLAQHLIKSDIAPIYFSATNLISTSKIKELQDLGKDFYLQYLQACQRLFSQFLIDYKKAFLTNDIALFDRTSHYIQSTNHQLGITLLLQLIQAGKHIIKNQKEELSHQKHLDDTFQLIKQLLVEINALIHKQKN